MSRILAQSAVDPPHAAPAHVLRRFGRDKRGVTAIEFSFIGLPFLALLLAIFQQGLYFLTSEAVGAAVQDAARQVYTGRAQGGSVASAADFIKTYICPGGTTNLSSLVDCSRLVLDVRPAPSQGSFDNVDTAPDFYQANASPQFCMGGPNDIVIVRLLYPMPVFAPGLGTGGTVNDVPNNPGQKQLILGTAVFQNEPFANGYQPPRGC